MSLNEIKKLFTPYDELKDIDDDLLLIALDLQDTILPYKTKTGNTLFIQSYQRLEFLGDSVLDLVISTILYDYDILKTEGDLTILKSKIVNNVSLGCLIEHLCPFTSKRCADLFETLIAIVYLHTNNNVNFVTTWLIEQWNIISVINYIINHPAETNVCQFINKSNNPPIQKIESKLTIKQKSIKNTLNYSKTFLENFYNYHKLTLPIQYIVINQPNNIYTYWNISISCPINLDCPHKIIGKGQGKTKVLAEQLAAQKALTYLEKFINS